MIKKFIKLPRKDPQPRTIGPKDNVAVCHSPPGINEVTIGMIILSTKDFTRAVAATPIMKAIARGITLYSLRKSLNSASVFLIHYLNEGAFYIF